MVHIRSFLGRSLLGIALAATLGAAAARADEVKLTFVTLAPQDSRVAQMEFHPWADRINAAGKGVVQLDVRDGFALANMDNVYSRVMDDVVQVGWGTQNAIGGKFTRSGSPACPSSRTIARPRRRRSGGFMSRARSMPNMPTSCR